VSELRFLPRWRRLEEAAFDFAQRAARATSYAERDRLNRLALSTWKARSDALLRAKQKNTEGATS
jgi:hypothetical protein